MSEETEVPIVCDDCGGNLTNAGGTIDDLFSMALGEDRPHYWHMEQSGCIASLNERLTDAMERAEAAEAERESVSSQLWDCMNEREALRVERDALRTRLDEWVRWGDRMASGHPDAPMASLDHEVRAVIANRYGMSVVTAAMAVQPTTGEAK